MSKEKELAFQDLDGELEITRRVLERLPEEHYDWKPHEKSTSLGKLGAHLVNILRLQEAVLTSTGHDFATAKPSSDDTHDREALLRAFDDRAAKVRAAFDGLEESEFNTEWTLRFGDRVIFARPRLAAFRSFGLSHLIHHRGQLSVYLRLLKVPVPSIYGPSADEPIF